MTAPRRTAGDVSAGWMLLLCLGVFLAAIVNVPSIWLTDEELAEPFWRVALLVGFWGGIAGMFYFGGQWRLERREARGEPEPYGRRQRPDELLALSHCTGVNANKIDRELKQRGITTADWAREHGIDPESWRPVK
jgi:hypothetical protein